MATTYPNQKAHSYIRSSGVIEKLTRSKIFWSIFVLLAFGMPLMRSLMRELPEELPIIHKLPEYELINEHGRPFGSKNLKGKVYLASFAFTSCPMTCPKLMKKLQIVQKRAKGLGTHFAMATFTVDPENDTPAVLNRYAREIKANPFVWSFLTVKGEDKEKLRSLLIKGFKVPMGDHESLEDSSLYDIAHSNRLVLIDKEGQVRGYYPTTKEGIDRAMLDLGILANRIPSKLFRPQKEVSNKGNGNV